MSTVIEIKEEEQAPVVVEKERDRYGVILEHRGKYLCVVETSSGFIGFPKGSQEKDESEHRCAQRELFEETGVHLPLSVLRNSKQSITFRIYKKGLLYRFFVISYFHWKTQPKVKIDKNEIAAYQWLTLEQLAALPKKSKSFVTRNVLRTALASCANKVQT